MTGLGWRGIVYMAVGILVLVLLATALLWLAIVVLAGLAVAALNFVYLPRLAAWLRLPARVLELGLLPLMAGAGVLLAGDILGAVWGGLFWAVVILLPRLALRELTRRGRLVTTTWRVERPTTSRQWPPPSATPRALPGAACPRCGVVSFGDTDHPPRTCPSCGAEMAAQSSSRG